MWSSSTDLGLTRQVHVVKLKYCPRTDPSQSMWSSYTPPPPPPCWLWVGGGDTATPPHASVPVQERNSPCRPHCGMRKLISRPSTLDSSAADWTQVKIVCQRVHSQPTSLWIILHVWFKFTRLGVVEKLCTSLAGVIFSLP
ncbi:hypothetical protein BsWGS_21818 [Bradybaena similaris]